MLLEDVLVEDVLVEEVLLEELPQLPLQSPSSPPLASVLPLSSPPDDF